MAACACTHTRAHTLSLSSHTHPLEANVLYSIFLHCRILLAVRDVCIDWLDGKERNDDPALKGDKDPKSGFHIEVPRR